MNGDENLAFFVTGFVTMLSLLAIVVGLTMWLSSVQCRSAWENSGMEVDWGPVKGCLLKRKDGTWIPARSYREVP